MKVFISWSGDRSRLMATALREWLPLILHYVEPWLSETDIGAGDRWAHELALKLEQSQFGVVCLTRENIESPWILFEAGALGKALEGGAVIPFLLDLDFGDFTGPLSQFQAKKADRESVMELVQGINRKAEPVIPVTRLNQLFNVLWPQFETSLKEIPSVLENSSPIRGQREILEDLVSNVRIVDQRLRTIQGELDSSVGMRKHQTVDYKDVENLIEAYEVFVEDIDSKGLISPVYRSLEGVRKAIRRILPLLISSESSVREVMRRFDRVNETLDSMDQRHRFQLEDAPGMHGAE